MGSRVHHEAFSFLTMAKATPIKSATGPLAGISDRYQAETGS